MFGLKNCNHGACLCCLFYVSQCVSVTDEQTDQIILECIVLCID